ncbi:MAG: hypothetical protein R6V23_11040 [Bacteroidales bacterium]
MNKKEEYRKRLKELGERKDLIPGVHNYCDRWCERCPFTSRCGSYALSEGFGEDQEENDSKNEKFWDDLKIIFEVTFEMIQQDLDDLGVDLDDIKDEDYEVEWVKNDATEQSKKYGFDISEWLKNHDEDLQQTAQKMMLVDENKLLAIKDAIEVVRWYSFFISAKIHRAFLKHEWDEEDEDDEYYMYDNNGSAKIALIAIDRSIAALGYILDKMPQYEDDLLHFLATLSKIKKDVLAAFPKAMEFKRPGFDD